jgi:basic amino acid/polyamine antiporter, APA family
MIGTGVFTSLGFQVLGIHSGFAIVFLWLIGGFASLLGALCYAELGAAMPRSGGEYFYLSKLYHPSVGFLAGWISFLVGFAAPVAAASIAFAGYLNSSVNISGVLQLNQPLTEKMLAVFLIVLISAVHLSSKKAGAAFQNFFTTLKILMIFLLIFVGLFHGNVQHINFMPDMAAWKDIISPAFVISLYFVSYSYSGWNAAAYIAGEIKNPKKTIPLSFFIGTFLVTGLYVLLNFVFISIIPIDVMAGKKEIGLLFANQIWGTKIGMVMGGVISFLLISTISSMVLAGPRVSQVIGEDYSLFKWFSFKNSKDIPTKAIIVQSSISIIYVFTSSFDQVITYIGFTLNLFTLLTIVGVILYRRNHPEIERPYKTFGYPVTPIIFIIISLWILGYGLVYKPYESMAGLLSTSAGLIFYFISKRLNGNHVLPSQKSD